MSATLLTAPATMRTPGRGVARPLMTLIVIAATTAAFLATNPDASAQAVSLAGTDLTRLLRAMALLKATFALAAIAVLFWRLSAPITARHFAAYALSAAAMAAGPGLIWGMAHVGLGALLLHTGLFATALLLWRDPAVATKLTAVVARRRHSLTVP